MSSAQLILTIVGIVFGSLTFIMLFMVSIIGTKYFKTAQFMLSSLSYDKDMDSKVTMLIERIRGNLAYAELNDGEIVVYETSSNRRLGVISIKAKYHHYGHLKYYGDRSCTPAKTSIRTFKRVVALEAYLESKTENSETAEVSKKKGEKESVILE